MDIQEFAALAKGDKIENPMNGSRGEVVAAEAGGVRVVWGGAEPTTANRFFYSVQSTAWMHWNKPEACSADDLERDEGALADRARE